MFFFLSKMLADWLLSYPSDFNAFTDPEQVSRLVNLKSLSASILQVSLRGSMTVRNDFQKGSAIGASVFLMACVF